MDDMSSKDTTLYLHKNTRIRVGMVCQQMISTSHFIKTQNIRYGWHGIETYDTFI